MNIDIGKLSEEELIDLNNRIIEGLAGSNNVGLGLTQALLQYPPESTPRRFLAPA